jgi:hypothetical protein
VAILSAQPGQKLWYIIPSGPDLRIGAFFFSTPNFYRREAPMELNLGTASLSDDELLRSFEDCQLDPAKFHHADHIRLAWLCARRHGPAEAEPRLLNGIRKMAQHAGVPQKFHYTMTIAWARLVAASCCKSDSCDSFYEWIAIHPELLNRNLMNEHYSTGKLETFQARCGWLDPDLKSLD